MPVYIREYADVAVLATTVGQAGAEPAVADQKLTLSGSTASSAFNVNTKMVRIHTDEIISVKFGTAPTAAATDARMAANTTEFFGVQPNHKVAAITNT